MDKTQGKLSDFAYLKEEGTRIVIGYGMKQVEGDLYEWYEVYLPKKQNAQITLQLVKDSIIADIDERVKAQIIGGMIWNGKPVWYSIENQLNFTHAVAPVTLKIGEQEDGTAAYEEFVDAEHLAAFCTACNNHKQNTLAAGWEEKDSIDWAPYEAQFPQQDKDNEQ